MIKHEAASVFPRFWLDGAGMPTSPNRALLTLFGPILIVVGVLGFVVPADAALTSGAAPYNLFHIGFGVLGMVAVLSRRLPLIRGFNIGFGLIDLYQGVASVLGWWPQEAFLWTRLDDGLHWGVGALLVGVGVLGDRRG